MNGFIILITIAIFFITSVPPGNADQSEYHGKRPNALPVQLIRVAIGNAKISPELIKVNNRLTMDGIEKELTGIQAVWIERFVTSIKNWLHLVGIILKTDEFKEFYKNYTQEEFDIWITGRKDQAFDMYYVDKNDPEAALVHYKLIIYRISISELGTVKNLNLKSFNIHFERSEEKLRTPKGEMVYRKDRIYEIELEAEFPILDLKFKHEIVRGKEQGDFNELELEEKQDVKPGYLRMRMSDVKIGIKLVLTEIDKRFVREDPVTGESYYFTKPEIPYLKFFTKQAEVFEIQFQKKPHMQEGFVGKNLPESTATDILLDFARFLVLADNKKELHRRLKTTLINRYSAAIMLSPNVLLLGDNVFEETCFYEPEFQIEANEDAMKSAYEVLYSSYSNSNFVDPATSFLLRLLKFRSFMKDELDPEQLQKILEGGEVQTPELPPEQLKKYEEFVALLGESDAWKDEQVAKADLGIGIDIDGFDWNE